MSVSPERSLGSLSGSAEDAPVGAITHKTRIRTVKRGVSVGWPLAPPIFRNLAYTPNWVSDAIKDSLIPTVEERKTGLLTQIHNTAASNVTASINEYVVLEELLKRLTAEANCIAKFDRDVIDEEDEDAEDQRFSMVPDEEYSLLYDTQVALLRLENATNRELSGAFEVSNCEWPENLKLFKEVMTAQTKRPSLWLDPQPPLLDLTSLLVATVGADAYQDAEGLSASAVAFNSEDMEDAEDIVEDEVDEDKDAPRAETDVKLDEFENKCAPFERVVWALSHRLIRQGALADQATYVGKGEMDKYEANEWIDDTDGIVAVVNDSGSEEESDMEVQYEDADLFVCDDNEENDEDDDYEEPVLHTASVTEDDISSGTKGFVDPKGWRLFREHLKARPNLEVLCLRLERELTDFLDSLRPEYPLLLAAMDYQVDIGRPTVCPLNHTPGEPPCGVVVLPPATSNGTVIANDVTAVSRRLYELFSARIREYIRETDAVALPERLTFADAVELDVELNRLPEELDTYLPLLVEVVVSHTTSLVPPGTGRGAVLTGLCFACTRAFVRLEDELIEALKGVKVFNDDSAFDSVLVDMTCFEDKKNKEMALKKKVKNGVPPAGLLPDTPPEVDASLWKDALLPIIAYERCFNWRRKVLTNLGARGCGAARVIMSSMQKTSSLHIISVLNGMFEYRWKSSTPLTPRYIQELFRKGRQQFGWKSSDRFKPARRPTSRLQSEGRAMM